MIAGRARRWVGAAARWAGFAWRALREVSGDDAYERYVAHRLRDHPGEPLMSRSELYAERERHKWGGVTRCC